MKNLLKSLIISLSLLITSSVIAEEAKSVQWLFVHTAETAEMTSETTLSMPVTKEIFAFSDRPNRLHHYLDAHGFAMLWFQGGENAFRFDPPNAVLTWTADGEVKESEIVLTRAMVFDDGERMEYTVQFGQEPILTNVILSNVSLFVDSIHPHMTMLMPCPEGCYRRGCGNYMDSPSVPEIYKKGCAWSGPTPPCGKTGPLLCNTETGQWSISPSTFQGCIPKPNSGVKLGPMRCSTF